MMVFTRAVMRIEGEKNFSEIFPSLHWRTNENGNGQADPFEVAWREHERATMFRENGAGVPFSSSQNGNGQAPTVQHELRTPRPPANGSEEGTAIFPYIPRKRQERNGLLIDYLYLSAPDTAGDQVDFFILGENRVGVLLADVAGKIDYENVPIIKAALRSNSAGLPPRRRCAIWINASPKFAPTAAILPHFMPSLIRTNACCILPAPAICRCWFIARPPAKFIC